jgi:dienelactone hydrolase
MRMTKLRLTGRLLCFVLMIACSPVYSADNQKITFKSSDGLLITADSYTAHPTDKTPLIVLFHQAGWSRGEYVEIAPALNKLGFNCIAVDLRSGDYIKGTENETAKRARDAKLAASYVDALPDVTAALQYARKTYSNSKVIAWGSSYSASLVLKVAGEKPGLVDGVMAFSPGEYFAGQGKSRTWIMDSAKNIQVPVFITSSSAEAAEWASIYKVIDVVGKRSYIPETGGKHGARALWERYVDSKFYWEAVTKFLRENYSI